MHMWSIFKRILDHFSEKPTWFSASRWTWKQLLLKVWKPLGVLVLVGKNRFPFWYWKLLKCFFGKCLGKQKNCLWSFAFLNGWTLLSLLSFSLTRFFWGQEFGRWFLFQQPLDVIMFPPRWWIVVYWCCFLPRWLKRWKKGHRTMGMSFWSRIWRGHVGFPWGFAKRRCFWKHWNQGFSVVYQPDWLFCLMNVKNILYEKANIWIESRRFPWITFLKYFDSNVFYLVKNHAILIFR